METAKENRKPTAIAVTKRSDLEKLIPGDVFQLSFNPEYKTIGTFVRYAGKVQDKIEVMIQDDEDYEKIISLKIHPNNIFFTEGIYAGAAEALVTKVDKEDLSEYLPGTLGYQQRLDLFKATSGVGWINPKTAKRTLNCKYLSKNDDNAIALVSFNGEINKVSFPCSFFEEAKLKEGDYFMWTAYPIRCKVRPSDIKASDTLDELCDVDPNSTKEVFDLDDYFCELRQYV